MRTNTRDASVEHAFNTLKSEIESDRLYEIARRLSAELPRAREQHANAGGRVTEAVRQWIALVEETAGTLKEAEHHRELLDRILSECKPRN